MDATEFVRKWATTRGGERATSQSHFLDLCKLLGEQGPTDADPSGENYAFEKGVKSPDGDGFADVWLRAHFAWEYKGKRKDLTAAYAQLQRYREALDNPKLLVVCDLERFEIHTNWTNTESWIYRFLSADIATDNPVEVVTIAGTPAKDAPEMTALRLLRHLFDDTDALKPQRTRDEITQSAAKEFGAIAKVLREWGTGEMEIARFITKVVFCMFATDVGLLPKGTFSDVISIHRQNGDAKAFRGYLSELFKKMDKGGKFHMQDIPHFNGELFRDTAVPDGLTAQEIHTLERLDALNWADVEPSIFGTLFEWVLDPLGERKILGAHYTSRDDIELIVEPVLMEPLRRGWRDARAYLAAIHEKVNEKRGPTDPQRAKAKAILTAFQRRLYTVRVLDPACGSGNFLYVSLALLKSLEKGVIAEAATWGIALKHRVHPSQLYGIEVNAYAHELASIVIWIGYLQWKRQNAIPLTDETPILQPLDQIEGKDAIVDRRKPSKPVEATWPAVDVIVGNPPFLGGKLLRTRLGNEYVEAVFAVWEGRVEKQADICCYWFEKARAAIEAGDAKRAGLLGTQGIRGGANRKTLDRIKDSGDIFYAQSDREWALEGATVHVSMVGFDDGLDDRRLLNDERAGDSKQALMRARIVDEIHADLTAGASDVTKARRLKENIGLSFMGDTKVGDFDIPGKLATKLIASPNPHGRPNADVVRPWVNGSDMTGRGRNMWIIDFPPGMSEADAAKYEAPFELIKKFVRSERSKNARKSYAEKWWIHGEPRPDMRGSLAGLARFMVTVAVSKHRLFAWVAQGVLADHSLFAFARSDDYFFGVMHSRTHEVWALLQGTQLESRPRYTPTTCFETFPFPRATQKQQWAISLAAKDLNELREKWLNPTEMIGAKELAKRTLTNLYNARPTWLQNAHRTLDEAVFAAYGWPEPPGQLSEAEIIARLLKLNFERETV